MLEEAEEKLRQETGWGCKIIEKPGVPLALLFIRRIPMIIGCPLGQKCMLCENKGTSCNTKSVVYKASCMDCEKMKKTIKESRTGG